MKLQKLVIHNLASIEDAVIDFESEPLASSEVFLITGKTGSGKSTILDAISLALFANTPRLYNTEMEGGLPNGNRDIPLSNPVQLLRMNTGEGFSKLTFTGINGVHYEAVWSIKRAHNKPQGLLQSKNWSLKNLDIQHTLSRDNEIKAEMQAAIGLDFNQFCRTTMLAQGEFTRFLNSRDAEKAGILQKITGKNDYSVIGRKVFQMTSEKQRLWEDAQAKMAGIQLLDDEAIAKKQAEIEELNGKQASLTSERTAAEQKIAWLETFADLSQRMKTASKEYENAESIVKSEDFARRQHTLNQWDKTTEARGWMRDIDGSKAVVARQNASLDALVGTYHQLKGGIIWQLANLQAQEDTIDQLLASTQESFLAAEKEVAALEESLQKADISSLHKKKEAFVQLATYAAQAMEHLSNLDAARQKRSEAKTNLETQAANIKEITAQSEALALQVHDARIRFETCKELYEKQHKSVEDWAKDMRAKLHIGDQCPVCRQTVSTLPDELEINQLVSTTESAMRKAEEEYEALRGQHNRMLAQIDADTKALHTAQKAYNEDRSVTLCEEKAQLACTKCGIETIGDGTMEALAGVIKSANTEKASIESKLKAAEEIQNKLKVSRLQLENARKRVESATQTAEACEAMSAIYDLMPSWQNLAAGAVKCPGDLLKGINLLYSNIKSAKDQISAAEEARMRAEKELSSYILQNEDITSELLSELYKFTTKDVAKVRQYVNRVNDSLSQRKAALEQLRQQHQDLMAKQPQMQEEDTAEALRSRKEAIDTELAQIGENKGAIVQQLEDNALNIKKMSKLAEDEKKRNAEYQKWSRLNNLIGDSTGSKFNKIAQSYVLSSLIRSANSYMRTLSDRYTLRVEPGTFIITIEDACQGFARRAASTISGGESFLVSLSLALALSDIGQRLTVDTLFIDEGFGTLSGEPLQNAVNTLHTLHTKSGRHVGIISHVEELQERIRVQIKVEQEGNNSSSKVEVVTL